MPPVSFYNAVFAGDFDPTPPAAAMAKPKKQEIVDLAKAFKRTYSDRPRRIA